MQPIVIAGAVAAGMSAASVLKRSLPDQEVVVFGKEPDISYGACGMPYVIGGQIESVQKLAVLSPEKAREKRGIDLRVRHEVVSLDRSKKAVIVRNIDTGEEFEQEYEKFVIATGARAVVPQIDGVGKGGVLPLKELGDSKRLLEYIDTYAPKNVVVVGGGYIGVEAAEAFRSRGLDVTLVEALPRILNILDTDFARYAAEEMQRNGVSIRTGVSVASIDGDDRATGVTLNSGESIPADLVLMSVGVRPNTEFAEAAGIELGDRNAVLVDRYLTTNDPSVFAAGDCATAYHKVLQRDVHVPLALGANRQGRLVGENIAAQLSGTSLNSFPGVLGTAVIKVFDGEVAKTGIGQLEVERYGLKDIDSVSITSHTIAGYYPGGGPFQVKLYFHKDSKKLLGGQLYGSGRSVLRIDALATAISAGMTLSDLYELDLAYAPPFSPVWDPLLVAARQGMKKR